MLNPFDLLLGGFLAVALLVLLLRWYYGEWPQILKEKRAGDPKVMRAALLNPVCRCRRGAALRNLKESHVMNSAGAIRQ